jgi:hypothetical protein
VETVGTGGAVVEVVVVEVVVVVAAMVVVVVTVVDGAVVEPASVDVVEEETVQPAVTNRVMRMKRRIPPLYRPRVGLTVARRGIPWTSRGTAVSSLRQRRALQPRGA